MPRKQKKYHYIYKTINIINGKFYIGMHSTSDLNDGYVGSGKRLWYSLNKYGKEKHTCEILEFLPDRKSLKQREGEIVNEKLLQDPLCINLKHGGEGGWDVFNSNSELQRQKAIKSNIKQKWLRENDPEWVKRKAEKISKSGKLAYAEGRNTSTPPDWTGKKHSEETKEKMRDAAKGKHVGEKNSQYGTCWIHSLTEKKSIKIKKEKLERYILEGWIKGRKIKF